MAFKSLLSLKEIITFIQEGCIKLIKSGSKDNGHCHTPGTMWHQVRRKCF